MWWFQFNALAFYSCSFAGRYTIVQLLETIGVAVFECWTWGQPELFAVVVGCAMSCQICAVDLMDACLQLRQKGRGQSTWTWPGFLRISLRMKPPCPPHQRLRRSPEASKSSLAGRSILFVLKDLCQNLCQCCFIVTLVMFTFRRLKRSHSTSFSLDEASETEFTRGGVRATAGPRLGWSHDLKHGAKYVSVTEMNPIYLLKPLELLLSVSLQIMCPAVYVSEKKMTASSF